MVLKSELNAGYKITVINMLAVPVLTYSFNIIDWQLQEIKKMDRKTRKLLTIYRMDHPNVDGIYISRKEGGRGLIQLECTYKITTIGLETYLKMKKDQLLRQVYHHEMSKKHIRYKRKQLGLRKTSKCKILKQGSMSQLHKAH